jgi:hypothetical protein
MLPLHGCGTLAAPEFQYAHSSSTEVMVVSQGRWRASVALYIGTSVRVLLRRIIKFSPRSAGVIPETAVGKVAMVPCLREVSGWQECMLHTAPEVAGLICHG